MGVKKWVPGNIFCCSQTKIFTLAFFFSVCMKSKKKKHGKRMAGKKMTTVKQSAFGSEGESSSEESVSDGESESVGTKPKPRQKKKLVGDDYQEISEGKSTGKQTCCMKLRTIKILDCSISYREPTNHQPEEEPNKSWQREEGWQRHPCTLWFRRGRGRGFCIRWWGWQRAKDEHSLLFSNPPGHWEQGRWGYLLQGQHHEEIPGGRVS